MGLQRTLRQDLHHNRTPSPAFETQSCHSMIKMIIMKRRAHQPTLQTHPITHQLQMP
jgi:hypothetical protein